MSEEKRRDTVVTLCNLGASVIMMYHRRAPTILDQHGIFSIEKRKKIGKTRQALTVSNLCSRICRRTNRYNNKQELIYKQKQRKGKKEQSCQWREKGNSLNLTVTRKCKNFEQKMMMMSSKKIYFQRKPKKKARMKITVVLP